MPYVRYDPYKPGDRERAYGNLFLNLIFFWGSLASIIYYICSWVSVFKGNGSENALYSSGVLVAMSIIDFFIVFSGAQGRDKKEVAKNYFLFFFGGAIDLLGVIGIIVSIVTLCNEDEGVGVLICSILVILTTSIVVILLYRRINGYAPISIRWFTEKKVSLQMKKVSSSVAKRKTVVRNSDKSETVEESYIFCCKCGKKLLGDSEFCSSCGAKLR